MTVQTFPRALVDTGWLFSHLQDPEVRILDATFFLPTDQRDAAQEFSNCHIPGAQRFDVAAIADMTSPYPNMLPSPQIFTEHARRLGVSNDMHVVVYDSNQMGAVRAWWMWRYFGHEQVSILNGGLGQWQADNMPLSATPRTYARSSFTASVNPALLLNMEAVRSVDVTQRAIVDVRGAGRFSGSEPEPRQGTRSGHMPGSCNIPYRQFFNAGGTFKNITGLQMVFEQAGIDPHAPFITTCGSGVTAPTAAFAAYLLGNAYAAVYDGSWSEWGSQADTPVMTL